MISFALCGAMLVAAGGLTVSQSDLVARYNEYNGKRVTVNGEVVSGPEMTVMYLPSATAGSVMREAMLITLSEQASNKPAMLTRRFTKDLKKHGRVVAELEGSFEGAADRRWGHQGCCRFRLQVERVVSLK